MVYCKDIQELILHNLPSLTHLMFNEGENFTKIDLSRVEKLEWLVLGSHNLPAQNLSDLSFLKDLVNLRGLCLWGGNKFYGSLEPLRNLNKLEKLDISDTDIDSGLEYLPESVKKIACSTYRKNAKCQTLYNLFTNEKGEVETEEVKYGVLDKYIKGHWVKSIKNFPQKLQAYKWKKYFTDEEKKLWMKAGIKLNEIELTNNLKQKGYQPNTTPDIQGVVQEESWRSVHLDFDYQLRKNWESKDFSKEQVQKWVTAGAKAEDYEFIKWLRDTKKESPQWITAYQEDYQILSERFKKYGVCSECSQLNTGKQWCKDCNKSHLLAQPASNNKKVNNFILKYQVEATDANKFIEWIPYEQFSRVEYLAEGGFGKVYKAKWWLGNISHWDVKNNQWHRNGVQSEDEFEKQKGELLQPVMKLFNELSDGSNLPEIEQKERREKLNSAFNDFLTFKISKEEFIKELDNIQSELSKNPALEEIGSFEKIRVELSKLLSKGRRVVLKSLNNSSINTDFLDETAKHKDIDDWFNNIVPCYGLSQDLNTGDYLMVMQYMSEGDLRKYLNTKNLTFQDKLLRLTKIIQGLKDIHSKGLVHRDFHSGNILNDSKHSLIADLGLCKPANETSQDKVFGVLPYVAPEVLQNQPYTQAADIYSFGIIAYELLANTYPYPDFKDLYPNLKSDSEKELEWAFIQDVCNGIRRPDIDRLKIPQELKDLIKRCWDTNPQNRLTAVELERIARNWSEEVAGNKSTPFCQQYQEIADEYNTFSQNTPYKVHPTAILNSKLIHTKKLETKEYHVGNTQEFTLDGIPEEFPVENQSENWQNIHPNFTEELIQQWTNHGFTYNQTQDWINIGMQPTDASFCAWLKTTKKVDAEWVQNHGNAQNLKAEFEQSHQTPQILHQPPKNN